MIHLTLDIEPSGERMKQKVQKSCAHMKRLWRCVECVREYKRDYVKANYKRSWYFKNKERCLAQARERYRSDPEYRSRALANAKKSAARRKDQIKEYSQKYYQRVRKGTAAEKSRSLRNEVIRKSSGYYAKYRAKTRARRRECANKYHRKLTARIQ